MHLNGYVIVRIGPYATSEPNPLCMRELCREQAAVYIGTLDDDVLIGPRELRGVLVCERHANEIMTKIRGEQEEDTADDTAAVEQVRHMLAQRGNLSLVDVMAEFDIDDTEAEELLRAAKAAKLPRQEGEQPR